MASAVETPQVRTGRLSFGSRAKWLWLVLPVLTVAALAALMIPRPNPDNQKLAGTDLLGRIAPNFRLKDQSGHTIQLTQFRGHPVVLTTMEASCRQLCPVAAETIRRSLAELGAEGRQVKVLALSMDPEADTPSVVKTFSRQHGMLFRWHYLNGPRKVLSPIWAAYYLYAAPPSAPPSIRDGHTSATFLIDSQGRERILMTGGLRTADLVRDIRILSGLPAGGTVAMVPAPEVGHSAPALALSTTSGSLIRLSSLHGRTVLINFWATWCKPCRSEMPMLAQWYRRNHVHNLTVLGVDEQESASEVGAFARKLHIAYPIVLDRDGNVSARYNVLGLPTTLLIDSHGTVRWVKPGILGRNDLSTFVQPVLAERTNS